MCPRTDDSKASMARIGAGAGCISYYSECCTGKYTRLFAVKLYQECRASLTLEFGVIRPKYGVLGNAADESNTTAAPKSPFHTQKIRRSDLPTSRSGRRP